MSSNILNNTFDDLLERMISHYNPNFNDVTHRDLLLRLKQCLSTTCAPCFMSKNEIQTKIVGLCEKFNFHGFITEAGKVESLYESIITPDLGPDDLNHRIAVLRFLFELSSSPTKFLATLPANHQFSGESQAQNVEIDWGAYLMEGIERWSPPESDKSDVWEDTDVETDGEQEHDQDNAFAAGKTAVSLNIQDEVVNTSSEYNDQTTLKFLLENVQSDWFLTNTHRERIRSKEFEANVALYIDKATGRFRLEELNTLSEYKVIREILFVMRSKCDSFCFKLGEDGKLTVKDNVTTPSLPQPQFKQFLSEFLPYIEMLDELHQFYLLTHFDVIDYPDLPETYRSYAAVQHEIINSKRFELAELEIQIAKQEQTWTLLRLAGYCRELFAPLCVLYELHKEVILDYTNTSCYECSVHLLHRLQRRLLHAQTKEEFQILMALNLGSLFKYICFMDYWLSYRDFNNINQEFIMDYNPLEKNEEWRDVYTTKILSQELSDSYIYKFIDRIVQPIGNHLYLLEKIGKYYVCRKRRDTGIHRLYNEFLDEFFATLGANDDAKLSTSGDFSNGATNTSLFAINQRELNMIDDFDDSLKNVCPIMLTAFEQMVETQNEDIEEERSIYKRVCDLNMDFYPAHEVFEETLMKVFEYRYQGAINVLKLEFKKEYAMDEHFLFLQRLFLFKNNYTVIFYNRILEMLYNRKAFHEFMLFSSTLVDAVIDDHPKLCENFSIGVNETWPKFYSTFKMNELFDFNYKVFWPMSLIITERQIEMYKGVFYFIFELKWALYLLQQLRDIMFRSCLTGKLKFLLKTRLILLNLFTTMQHFILGYVHGKGYEDFERDYNRSNDFYDIKMAHERFINFVHRESMFLRMMDDYYPLLCLVDKLHRLSTGPWKITYNELVQFERLSTQYYNTFQKIIDNKLSFIPI